MARGKGASANAETGSRASTMPASGHGPAGFDPARNGDDIDISVCDICGAYYEWHRGLVGCRCGKCSRL
jgi:hypothetical protein